MEGRGYSPSPHLASHLLVGGTLLGGLLVSVTVMVVGLVVAAVEGKETTHVLPLNQVVAHLSRGEPSAILDLGILLLFATPLAGVLVASIVFLRERDFAFTLITVLLLVILVLGFVVALQQ